MTEENVTTIPQVSEIAHQVRENIVSAVKDQNQRTLDAFESIAQATAKATESFPTPPAVPGIPTLGDANAYADLKALTVDGYGLAQDLLTAQRDFSLQLIAALTPVTSA